MKKRIFFSVKCYVLSFRCVERAEGLMSKIECIYF